MNRTQLEPRLLRRNKRRGAVRVTTLVAAGLLSLVLSACTGPAETEPSAELLPTLTTPVTAEPFISAEETAPTVAGEPETDVISVSVSDPIRVPEVISGGKPLGECDLDLTEMSANMVYAQIYQMENTPEVYMGKIIRVRGTFSALEGQTRNYYACFLADTAFSHTQGIEFVLAQALDYPEEYPESGATITVLGRFETYTEGERTFCQLADAVIEDVSE